MHKIVFGSNFSFPFFKSIASMVLLAVLLIKWNSIARECHESKESLRDFNQYYAGALAVVNGQSSSLYPEPIPNAQRNAGIDAIPKKTFVELCIEYGVPVGHFIQPPIAAWIMSPLVLCDFPTARLIFCWIGLISVFLTLVIGWFIAFGIQGQLLNSVVVSEILSIFFFGKFYLSVTIGNISPVIGFIIAAAVLCSINDKLISAFFLLLLAGLLKITPIFLIFPVFVTLKKTKITFLIILLACAASSFYLVSMSLWQEFFVKILPTLGKTWLDKNCKSTSIFGFVSDFFSIMPLPKWLEVSLKLNFYFGIFFLILLIVIALSNSKRNKDNLISSFILILGWISVFAPLSWSHYSYYMLCFFFGFLPKV